MDDHGPTVSVLGRTPAWRVTGLCVAGLCVAAVGIVALGVHIGLAPALTVPLVLLVAGTAALLYPWWTRRHPRSATAVIGSAAVASLVVLTLVQFVPHGRSHSNPPATGEPDWADARTRDLMVAACFGCHSSEVEYPPYAWVAPISWIIENDVQAARREVNFSRFATDPGEGDDSVDVLDDGEMPPAHYTRFGLHPDARLTDDEVAELIDGLRRTPGLSDD